MTQQHVHYVTDAKKCITSPMLLNFDGEKVILSISPVEMPGRVSPVSARHCTPNENPKAGTWHNAEECAK